MWINKAYGIGWQSRSTFKSIPHHALYQRLTDRKWSTEQQHNVQRAHPFWLKQPWKSDSDERYDQSHTWPNDSCNGICIEVVFDDFSGCIDLRTATPKPLNEIRAVDVLIWCNEKHKKQQRQCEQDDFACHGEPHDISSVYKLGWFWIYLLQMVWMSESVRYPDS